MREFQVSTDALLQSNLLRPLSCADCSIPNIERHYSGICHSAPLETVADIQAKERPEPQMESRGVDLFSVEPLAIEPFGLTNFEL